MKIFEQITIVVIIVILVIILDIITFKITSDSIKNMLNQINDISKLIDTNIYEAKEKSKSIFKDWEELERKMNYYLEHDELEKVSKQIVILETQIQTDNILEAKPNISEIKFLLEHIEEKPKMKINNIF